MLQKKITVRTMTYCALLAALSVVLARLIGLMPDAASRFSIEAVPIFLAGMFYGYNPVFCVPPILYGVFAGLFRPYLSKGINLLRLTLAFLPPVVLGSLLYQSAMLSWFYFKGSRGSFLQGYGFYLSTRAIQFAVVLVLDVIIIQLLYKSGIFNRMGLWQNNERK